MSRKFKPLWEINLEYEARKIRENEPKGNWNFMWFLLLGLVIGFIIGLFLSGFMI